MNGTALRKPTVRRVVGMVAGIVIIALGIALFKQKTAYEISLGLVGSEMCIRDSDRDMYNRAFPVGNALFLFI